MTTTPAAPTRRRLLWTLIALCAVSFAAGAPRLVYPDLNLDYPFVDGDSHDWIANGLFWTGADVRYSGRAPLLPLALAALQQLGVLHLWPLVALALFLATVVGFFAVAAELFPAAAAFAAALLLLANYSLQGLALDVMADMPASCLMFWSLRAFLLALGAPASTTRRYLLSGFLAGLAGLTQMIGLVVPIAAGLTLALRRRRDLARRGPWLGAAAALACTATWLLVRRYAFAARGDTLENKAALIGFHVSSLRFYLWSLLSLLGLPACLLLTAGIVVAAARVWPRAQVIGKAASGDASPAARRAEPEAARRRATADDSRLANTAPPGPRLDGAAATMILLVLGGTWGFFTFLWRYDAKRFMVFCAWPAGLLVAAALAPLARSRRPAWRVAFLVTAGLAVAAGALPLPEPAYDATWAALWPLPPVAGRLPLIAGLVPDPAVAASGSGSAGLASRATRAGAPPATAVAPAAAAAGPRATPEPPAQPGISFLPWHQLAAWSQWSRVAAAWAARPPAPPAPDVKDPARFAAQRAALYLYEHLDDGGGRYRTITRLSAALHKPVRFVPRACLDRYASLLVWTEPAIRLSPDYLVQPAAVHGLDGTWLLVTPPARPLPAPQSEAAPAAAARVGDEKPPPGAEPATGVEPATGMEPTASVALAAAARDAAAIAAFTGRDNAYVALFWRPRAGGLLQFLLPFLLETGDLYIVAPPQWDATRQLFAVSAVEDRLDLAGARVLKVRVRGLRTSVITTAPVPRPHRNP